MYGPHQVMIVEKGNTVCIPTMDSNEHRDRPLISLLDNSMVVELKVASALVRRILVDTRSSTNVISCD